MADNTPRLGLNLDSRARSIEGTRKIVQDRMWRKEAVQMEKQLQEQVSQIDQEVARAGQEIQAKLQKITEPEEAGPLVQQAIELQNGRYDQVMNVVANASVTFGKNPHAQPAIETLLGQAQQRHQTVLNAVLEGRQRSIDAYGEEAEEQPEETQVAEAATQDTPRPPESGTAERPRMQTEEGEFAGGHVTKEEMRRLAAQEDAEAEQYLKDKFGEEFVLPKDRDDNTIANDVANLRALSMAEPGQESKEFSTEVLGKVAYDYELELEALEVEARKRGMNLTAFDGEGQERLDEWRRKKKKFEGPKEAK